jgi:hypothetical protein
LRPEGNFRPLSVAARTRMNIGETRLRFAFGYRPNGDTIRAFPFARKVSVAIDQDV